MSASQQYTKYIQHCVKKDTKPRRTDLGPLQTQNGVVVIVSWSISGRSANNGQADGFLDVNKGDSTFVTVQSPGGLPPTKFPVPTSISGSASWVGGPKPVNGIGINAFTLKVNGPQKNGKDVLKIDLKGLLLPNGDSVTATFAAAQLPDDETNFAGQTKTTLGEKILFALKMTTGTQRLIVDAA